MAWSQKGVRVIDVPDGSAAALAGLREGDRIIAIDGQNVTGLRSEEVRQKLTGEVGSFVKLRIRRDEQTLELRIERAPYERDKRDGA